MLVRLNAAERVGMGAVVADGYSSLLVIIGFLQNQRLIRLYRRLTWEAVEWADRTNIRILALLRDGLTLYISCEWELAHQRFDAGVLLAEQLGNTRQLANIVSSDATAYFLQGKYNESFRLWTRIYQVTVNKDNPQAQAWALYGQGVNLLMLGMIAEAIRKLEACFQVSMKGAEDKILTASRTGMLSLAYLHNNQSDLAFEYLMEHNKSAPAPSAASIITFYLGQFEAVLEFYEGVMTGKIQLEEPQVGQLSELFRRLPKSLNAMRNLPANQAGVWLYKGIHARLTGKPGEAVGAWTKSLESARRHGQPYEQARALLELGQLPSLQPALRREYLTEACALFETLGTIHDSSAAKAALQQLTSASRD
jgi:tetratricopeptide (TPR) repeat protein